MANNVPYRPTAQFYYMKVGLANVAGYVYTPVSDVDTLPIYGPVTDGNINIPFDRNDQTAGGDPGHMEIFTRKGIWEVRGAAMMDIAEVFGDTRMGSLIGKTVEFLCLSATGLYVAKGVGKLEGHMTFPAKAADPIMRDFSITRWLPSTVGDLTLANLLTGVFNTSTGY